LGDDRPPVDDGVAARIFGDHYRHHPDRFHNNAMHSTCWSDSEKVAGPQRSSPRDTPAKTVDKSCIENVAQIEIAGTVSKPVNQRTPRPQLPQIESNGPMVRASRPEDGIRFADPVETDLEPSSAMLRIAEVRRLLADRHEYKPEMGKGRRDGGDVEHAVAKRSHTEE
jgi:hypothetical protein